MRKATLINLIFSGFFVFLASIMFVLMLFEVELFGDGNFTAIMFFTSLAAFLFGGFGFARRLKDSDIDGAAAFFLRLLGWILGLIGFAILAFSLLMSITEAAESGGALDWKNALHFMIAFGCIFAAPINLILRKMGDILPCVQYSWPEEFFDDYGYMVVFAVSAVGSFFIGLFNMYSVILLIFNILGLFFFYYLHGVYFNSYDGSKWHLVLAYLLLAVITFVNIIALVGMLEMKGLLNNLTVENFYDAKFAFDFACSGFFFLMLIMGIPLLEITDKIADEVNRDAQSIVFFCVPVVCFGVQFAVMFIGIWALIVLAGLLYMGIMFSK